MTTSTSPTPLPVLHQPERCCPIGQCDYSPSRVRTILRAIRSAREDGDDPGEHSSAFLGSKGDGRTPGASVGSDTVRHATAVWDVLAAQQAIGGRPSAEAISERLCPFGGSEEA